ncbi:phosphoglycolate phosphatase [Sporomusaceae bacterium FL31]|nr:phosphoglycolate phosphatase [Sporomusaceae bacterium FL31]GCE35485.1 phosphoglycolate phosphatase [Sporomusaceae bacterium]
MYDIILFDLDGTLTDPKPGITKSVQYALAKLGIDEPNLENLVPFIGPPLLKAFKEFYHLDDEQATLALQYYRERFATVGLYENAVFPGIKTMLAQLKRQGKILIVATSKPTVFSIKIIEHFGLQDYFQAVIGSNLDGTRVEKGEVIEFALSELDQVDSSKIIMVGDRKHDVIGAKNNGIDVIAITYGYGSLEELNEAEPTYIVNTVQELHDFLQAN